jgi:hypothetical protein
MSDEINVVNREQIIFVEPSSGAVSVIGAGPPGPAGSPGPQGPQGIQGPQGPAGGGTSTPLGITVSGGSVSAPAGGQLLTLTTVIRGPASWLAGNQITLPAGADGIYLLTLDVAYTSPTVAAVGFDIRNSAAVAYGLVCGGMVNPGNPTSHINGAWIRKCVAAETFRIYNNANPITAGNASVARFSMVRLGTDFAP